jgi:hypothetical protein
VGTVFYSKSGEICAPSPTLNDNIEWLDEYKLGQWIDVSLMILNEGEYRNAGLNDVKGIETRESKIRDEDSKACNDGVPYIQGYRFKITANGITGQGADEQNQDRKYIRYMMRARCDRESSIHSNSVHMH